MTLPLQHAPHIKPHRSVHSVVKTIGSEEPIQLPGCIVRPSLDWLFQIMAAPRQGWHIQYGDTDIWPQLAPLDGAVITAIHAVAQQHGRLAIGVPRVVTGLILGPAIYSALNLLVQRAQRDTPAEFVPLPLPRDSRIALV